MTTNVLPVFEALSDPTRLRIVEVLGDGPRPAGEIADLVGASRPALSRHLKVLLLAGVIADERGLTDARQRVFRLRPEGIDDVEVWLGQLRRQWETQLRSFKRHVEGRTDG